MASARSTEIEEQLAAKNRQIEELFLKGRVSEAIAAFYTEDVRYLTPDFKLLRGRAEVTEFLTAIHAQFPEVRLQPFETRGDPKRGEAVYQFANATLRPADGSAQVDAHYVALFRRVGSDWQCEMEAPAFGRMTDAAGR